MISSLQVRLYPLYEPGVQCSESIAEFPHHSGPSQLLSTPKNRYIVRAVMAVPASSAELERELQPKYGFLSSPDDIDVFPVDVRILFRKPPIGEHGYYSARQDDIGWTEPISHTPVFRGLR